MATDSRHAARTQVWPALAAGRAPLSLGMAPAAERWSVRRPSCGARLLFAAALALICCIPAAAATIPRCEADEPRDLSEIECRCNEAVRLWFVYGDLEAVEEVCTGAIAEAEAVFGCDERLVFLLKQLGFVYAVTEGRERDSEQLIMYAVSIREGEYSPQHPCILGLLSLLPEPAESRKDEVSPKREMWQETAPNKALQRTGAPCQPDLH